MPCFNYTFIDVQKIYQDMEGLKDQLSLEKMLGIFEVNVEGLVQHKSDDDAHITMLVTEALCRKTGKSLSTLVKESKRAVCLSKNFMPKKKKQKTATGAVSGDNKVQETSAPKANHGQDGSKVKQTKKQTKKQADKKQTDKKPASKGKNRRKSQKPKTEKADQQ